jgi:hypothetical protein
MDTTEKAFHQVCDRAENAKTLFVSLYCDDRFYGGPEEGGWYGTDTRLIASQRVYSREMGDRMKTQVEDLARKLTRKAEDDRNRQLAAECEYLEERGVDDYDNNAYLSPPDGGSHFWVAVEPKQGSLVSTGDRAYS